MKSRFISIIQISIVMYLFLNISRSYAGITLYVQPDTLQGDSTSTLSIWLDNPEDELGAIAFDLGFDTDYFTVTAINQTTRSDSMDMINYNALSFGIRIAVSSIGHTIKPGAGSVLEITVDVAKEACGSYLWNIWCMNWGPLDPECTGLETELLVISPDVNDVNDDGCTDVLDVMATVDHLLRINLLSEEELERADCNADDQIDVLDVVGIVRVILGLGECGP